jgi:hypothetical protein
MEDRSENAEADSPTPKLQPHAVEYAARQHEMRYYFVALYDWRGYRRKKEDIKRVGLRAGYLLIEPVDPASAPGGASFKATVGRIHPAHTEPYFPALYNPALVRSNEQQLFLRGFQVNEDGSQTAQVWMLRRCAN